MSSSFPTNALRVMRVRRDKEGSRISAAPVHFDPTDFGPDSAREQPSVWVDACCAAGLLPDDAPIMPPLSHGGGDQVPVQPPVATSTVAVFAKPANRFPMVPISRGTCRGATGERVWVGASPTPATSDHSTQRSVVVAHYGQLTDASLDEVAAAKSGGGPAPPRNHQQNPPDWSKTIDEAQAFARKAAAKSRKTKKKAACDSDDDDLAWLYDL